MIKSNDDNYYYPQKDDNENLRAIIIGVNYDPDKDFDHSMEEMEGLTKALDMEVAGIMTQSLPHPDNATYLGRGKVVELKTFIENMKATHCICEGSLSPSQMHELEDILKVPVWDRTNLILEIFSRRAKSREARLQVELAYLQFMLPRLTGMWSHLGRQGGGGGRLSNKGEGEKQIELDRREINHRIAELNKELKDLTKTRQVQREGRDKGMLPKVALVGYTNAGKSSIMNRYITECGADKFVLEKDMLFATLDTSIRKIKTEDGREFLLSDTVGFIEDLPHSLIKAFRSTLDEVKYSDLILIVLDVSDPHYLEHKKVTEQIMEELDAVSVPRLYVLNKSDMLDGNGAFPKSENEERVFISAKTGEGIDLLTTKILDKVYGNNKQIKALIPYNKSELTARIRKFGTVTREEYQNDGIMIEASVSPIILNEVLPYEQ